MALVAYINISANINLQKLDLNNDGFFNGDELTPEVEEGMKFVTNDTARLFAFITGILYAAVITFLLIVFSKVFSLIRKYFMINKSRMTT